MKLPDDLQAGDILLYSGEDLVDQAILLKEGDEGPAAAAHVEIYMGHGVSYASRNGIGVNAYDFRREGLRQVRRPVLNPTFDRPAVERWFAGGVRGLPYGFGDIAAAFNLRLVLGGVDCSHFAASLLAVAGCQQFDATFPFNKLTPRDFKLSLESAAVWRPDVPTGGGAQGVAGGAPATAREARALPTKER